MHLLFSGQYLTTCLTSSIKIYLRVSKFFKVYVTLLRRQKRPFRPLPGFRWYPRLRGHKFHCPIIIKIMDRPFLRYRKHLGENRLTRSKGVASSNLGLSSPHKGKGPLFFFEGRRVRPDLRPLQPFGRVQSVGTAHHDHGKGDYHQDYWP